MYNNLSKLLSKQSVIKVILLIYIFQGFSSIAFPQMSENRIDQIIQNVVKKSNERKSSTIGSYGYKFSSTIYSDKLIKKRDSIYELHCSDTGICQNILIEKNGKSISKSKIEKSRKKVSKIFASLENKSANNTVSYGLPFGYVGVGKSIWVDPLFYLKDCQVISFKKVVEGKNIISLRLGNCNVDNEEWKNLLTYMTRTEADLWINEDDESVVRLVAYAKEEIAAVIVSEKKKPSLKVDYMKTAEGFWVFKSAELDTSDKSVFPNLSDSFKYEFFDYKYFRVDVKSTENALPK